VDVGPTVVLLVEVVVEIATRGFSGAEFRAEKMTRRTRAAATTPITAPSRGRRCRGSLTHWMSAHD
jgi:hypothetical protein